MTHPEYEVARFFTEKYIAENFPESDIEDALAEVKAQAAKQNFEVLEEYLELETILSDAVVNQLFFFLYDNCFTVCENSNAYASFVKSIYK